MPVPEDRHRPLVALLRGEFPERFDVAPGFAVRAPGRVNLIGEHTDYNAGLVLPCAIDRETVIVGAAREDLRVRVHSREAGVAAELSLAAPFEPQGDWLDYVRGAIEIVSAETGRRPPGLDLAIASDVPGESGLSSSAAFGVALVTALERAMGIAFSAADRGRLAHRSEREFVGVPCGIMDQYASALGQADHALRIDCRSLALEAVPLPGDALRVLVAGSGVRRRLASGGYGDRAAECEAARAAAGELFERAGRVAPETLRDLTRADLPTLAALEPALFRRLRHVVTENQRVEDFCRALSAADFAGAGRLLKEGMASLRDDFEVSVPELDHLCEVGDRTPGVYGSRLTGAGFGGCTVHLVAAEYAGSAGQQIAAGFAERYGRTPPVFEIAAADGASILF